MDTSSSEEEDDSSGGGEEAEEEGLLAAIGGSRTTTPSMTPNSSINVHYSLLEIGGAEFEDSNFEEGGEELYEPEEDDDLNYADDESSDSEEESISESMDTMNCIKEEPNYFVPGWFTIVHDTVVKYRALVTSPVIRKIKAGEEVFVKHVTEVNSRTRGLLRKGGWISIENHMTNKIFAERKPDPDFTTVRTKKKSGPAKRVRFASTSRSLRSLHRGTVNSLSALSKRSKADPPSNPVWYQARFYYECDSTDTDEESTDLMDDSDKEEDVVDKSTAPHSPPAASFDATCEYKLPSPLDQDAIEKQPDSPIPCLQVTDMAFRKSSEDSSAKENFSSPSIDMQSSEDFSLMAESPSQSSESEVSDNEAPCFAYGSWAAKLEKDVFNKDFDQEAFLKSLNDDANIFSPPDTDNGRSLLQSPRFTRPSRLRKAECNTTKNDDEQTAV